MRHFWSKVLLVGVLALAVSGCGDSPTGGNKALKIGTDLPVTGAQASSAKPAENGVRLAVMQNQDLGNGYTLSLEAKDDDAPDQSGPSSDVGKANIQALIDDPAVVAGVGPFNSGIAKFELPLINGAGLTFISPSNTNPGLTKQQFAAANGINNFGELHPAGKSEAYFRLPGTDDAQGAVIAKLAALPQALGGPQAQTAFVLDDSTTYGVGLANYMSDAFKTNGGTILGRASTDGNLATLAQTIIHAKPDIVFYGGESSTGGAALKKLLAAGGMAQLPFFGGDGIADDPAWSAMAGAGASGTVATIPAPDVTALVSSAAIDVSEQYHQQFPNADYTPFVVLGYDCAMIEITAIKHLIHAGKPVTRATVRDAVAHLTYGGLTGTIAFDGNGDNTGPKLFSVYEVDKKGAWVPVRQING